MLTPRALKVHHDELYRYWAKGFRGRCPLPPGSRPTLPTPSDSQSATSQTMSWLSNVTVPPRMVFFHWAWGAFAGRGGGRWDAPSLTPGFDGVFCMFLLVFLHVLHVFHVLHYASGCLKSIGCAQAKHRKTTVR